MPRIFEVVEDAGLFVATCGEERFESDSLLEIKRRLFREAKTDKEIFLVIEGKQCDAIEFFAGPDEEARLRGFRQTLVDKGHEIGLEYDKALMAVAAALFAGGISILTSRAPSTDVGWTFLLGALATCVGSVFLCLLNMLLQHSALHKRLKWLDLYLGKRADADSHYSLDPVKGLAKTIHRNNGIALALLILGGCFLAAETAIEARQRNVDPIKAKTEVSSGTEHKQKA